LIGSGQVRCWAAIRLSHYPEPSGYALHWEVPGLRCSWQGHSGRVGADVGESLAVDHWSIKTHIFRNS